MNMNITELPIHQTLIRFPLQSSDFDLEALSPKITKMISRFYWVSSEHSFHQTTFCRLNSNQKDRFSDRDTAQ